MGRLDTVQAGHANVEQHNVRRERDGLLNRLLAVARVADEVITIEVVDNLVQAFARRAFVIDDQHFHAACSSGKRRRTE